MRCSIASSLGCARQLCTWYTSPARTQPTIFGVPASSRSTVFWMYE